MTKVTALRELADDIEANGPTRPRFNMLEYARQNRSTGNVCDTAACIAGYTLFKWLPDEFTIAARDGWTNEHTRMVRQQLGLTVNQANGLFTPYENIAYRDITPTIAVAQLRWLADYPDAQEHVINMHWRFLIGVGEEVAA